MSNNETTENFWNKNHELIENENFWNKNRELLETTENLWNECLASLWNDPDATLVGFGDGYAEAIGRDQAVDDDGNAIFNSYVFIVGDGYEEDLREWKFTAAEVEAFARTW